MYRAAARSSLSAGRILGVSARGRGPAESQLRPCHSRRELGPNRRRARSRARASYLIDRLIGRRRPRPAVREDCAEKVGSPVAFYRLTAECADARGAFGVVNFLEFFTV